MKAIINFFTRTTRISEQKAASPLSTDWEIEKWAEKSYQGLVQLLEEGKINESQADEFTAAINKILTANGEGAAANLDMWGRTLAKIRASLENGTALKTSRRIISATGVLWILIVLMQPPFLSEERLRGSQGQVMAEYRTPIGHHWIWSPPSGVLTVGGSRFQTSEPYVDIQRLLIYVGIGAVAVGSGTILMRQPRVRA